MKTKLIAIASIGVVVCVWLLINVRNYATVYNNSIGMKFVRIPSGSFEMGYDTSSESVENLIGYFRDFQVEYYFREATIEQSFWMSQQEVTYEQFCHFVDETGFITDNERMGKSQTWRVHEFPTTGVCPVASVSCNDATAFCKWLSEKEGKLYRLPTEAEWEYACRAGTTTLFSFGNDPSLFPKYGNIADQSFRSSELRQTRLDLQHNHSSPWNDEYPFSAPVGSFLPNGLGLYDMHGNVSEICSDFFQVFADGQAERIYPQDCVVRGGSWGSWEVLSTSFHRFDRPRDVGSDIAGFRVVLEEGTMSKSDLDD